jgi:hypothetical protein
MGADGVVDFFAIDGGVGDGDDASEIPRAQVKRIIAALLAIESLAADAEVTAGTGRVAVTTIEIYPDQANPGFPAELHGGPSQSARTGWLPFANETLMRVSLIILNGNSSRRTGITGNPCIPDLTQIADPTVTWWLQPSTELTGVI